MFYLDYNPKTHHKRYTLVT